MTRPHLLAGIAAAAALAAFAPTASAVELPVEGASTCYVGYGTTPIWSSATRIDSTICLSKQTAFYGYKPDASHVCFADGYRAQVSTASFATPSYAMRFDEYICDDGQWHFTPRWPYNEWRFSSMLVNSDGVDWSIVMYQ